MVKIRLKRVGAKKKPSYRVVVADSKSARNGKIIAQLGFYDPMCHPAVIKIDTEAVDSWIAKGAQLTDSMQKLLDTVKKAS